ncbi:MAG: hypothetical protein HOW71_36070 [Nonomuraea sp.]|nr:hypothetical protein [Nonomuraea sp.]
MYLFAHETLRVMAEQRYGAGLAAYRDRLHDWAETYWQRGWPADTPQYLLRSYSRMLASVGDLPRLVTCGIDQARHDRMRALTGGDALAFTEIGIAQQRILAQPEPDLISLVRLTAYRDRLTDHYSFISEKLPAAWARIGQFGHAEALVNSISDWWKRSQAWCSLVEAASAGGDRDRAAQWADEAEAFIARRADPLDRAPVLAELAEAVAAGGDSARAARLVGEAEALAGQATYPGVPTWKLAQLAAAVVNGGDSARVAQLMDEAETRVRQSGEPYERVGLTARLVELAALGGDHDRAGRLTGEAQALIGEIGQSAEPYYVDSLTRELVTAVAAGGDYGRAEALARQISTPYERAMALSKLAAVAVTRGDRAARLVADAEALAGQMIDSPNRASALSLLVEVAAVCGDRDRAARWAGEAQTLIRKSPPHLEGLLGVVAEALATGGDRERAEAIVGQISNRVVRAYALIRLAKVATSRGDHDRAAWLLRQAEAPDDQIGITDVLVLVHLVEALAVGGDRDRAVLLADAVEALIGRTPAFQDLALPELALAVAASGDYGRAEALVWQISRLNVQTVIRLVELAAAGGDHHRAARLAGMVEAAIEQFTDRYQQVDVLTGLAVAVAGDRDQAARLVGAAHAVIGQITDRDERESALPGLVTAVAVTGDFPRAVALTGQIADPYRRVTALARLAEAAATDGDREQAVRLVGAAEAHVGQIVESPQLQREWVLNQLIVAAATAGDHARAEALAEQLTEPRTRAEALARIAGIIAEASKKRASMPGGRHDASALMTHARHLLARALTSGSWNGGPGVLVTGSWGEFVIGLAHVDPLAAAVLADDMRVRWGLNALAAETAPHPWHDHT